MQTGDYVNFKFEFAKYVPDHITGLMIKDQMSEMLKDVPGKKTIQARHINYVGGDIGIGITVVRKMVGHADLISLLEQVTELCGFRPCHLLSCSMSLGEEPKETV